MAFTRPMTLFPRTFLLTLGLVSLVICCLSNPDSSLAQGSENQAVFPQTDRVFVRTLLAGLAGNTSPPDRIVRISEDFLGRPYKANTLIGNATTSERLSADLSGFDCFTFLDVVDALRRSTHAEDFLSQLINVRYREDDVAYLKRRHFFSDWVNRETRDIIDVTATIDPSNTKIIYRQLNKRSDGSLWVESVPVVMRTITYLPSSQFNKTTLEKLESGDYLGFYSSMDGLDVQHTGILVKSGDRLVLRHASSVHKAVVDDNLMDYLQGQEGLVVYRVGANE